MKITTGDVATLSGKFIVQINSNTPDATITEGNWGFWQEKRISFISGLVFQGFFYENKKFTCLESFVDYFNNYLVSRPKERFHRLLTSKELDFLVQKMKENNY